MVLYHVLFPVICITGSLFLISFITIVTNV
nr:MAG TPA: hypothetical protein [Caudoviricetes sp.]